MITEHAGDPRVRVYPCIPTILIEEESMFDIEAISNLAPNTNIAVCGKTKILDSGNIFIYDIDIPKQETTSTVPTFETKDENIGFVGYIRNTKGVISTKEENTQSASIAGDCDVLVRGTFDPYGVSMFDVFMDKRGMVVTNCSAKVDINNNEERRKYWVEQIEEYVEKDTPMFPVVSVQSAYGGWPKATPVDPGWWSSTPSEDKSEYSGISRYGDCGEYYSKCTMSYDPFDDEVDMETYESIVSECISTQEEPSFVANQSQITWSKEMQQRFVCEYSKCPQCKKYCAVEEYIFPDSCCDICFFQNETSMMS